MKKAYYNTFIGKINMPIINCRNNNVIFCTKLNYWKLIENKQMKFEYYTINIGGQ